MRTRIPLITAIIVMLLLTPAAAGAALVGEQRQGQNLIAQLNAGTKTCSRLSADDLDHIGEYVMFKAVGSTIRHQAMNDRMTLMMGEQAETRMHRLLGARYAGCSTRGLGIAGTRPMMGGTWQDMSRKDWRQLQQRLLGTRAMHDHTGWSALAIVGALAATVLVLLAILAITRRRPFRRPPTTAPTS